MKKGLLVLAIAGGLIAILFLWTTGIYNRLVTSEEGVKTAWSQVENVYQRRADLIPNLVETVRGYAEHEKETLTAVVEARSKVASLALSKEVINDPTLLNRFQENQGALTQALSRLMVVVEKYPDLKANQNFLALQSQLEGTENRVTVERMRFNEASQTFNTLRRTFPNVFIANLFGFVQKAYFQADAGSEKTPQVKF
ncbi:MAG: LemA family protein [Deltaproteobacteria bacterium RIFCSPLOWO2_12_FULL_40_28]|nr:MAG: LemA family protein [Deltaproteobacteria bacterium RIFCSPHIGHO2_02_FULL_40_28]OGQ19757.1 MAG: LemA family protein [Deltaproteobacteria bacterium RIFCSPHIGHO2_12_FULL_40_32]OGQ41034.1 MAG: LemA family protein [Deltaproteobacteria bacterium RIFCSPLOWO2_02_FULL_40_36]OGQ54150.1 MAG: LemA family protein [Deltaproteobacteria bacterium RIFCSPLOWO2_12_FULL_40_28]